MRHPVLVPEDLRRNGRNAGLQSLYRACLAAARHGFDPTTLPADFLARSWPSDRDAARLLTTRAAVSPASTSNTTALLDTLVVDFIASLTGASAAAALLGQGLQLAFDRHAAISVPGFDVAVSDAAFVAEGAPIPVEQSTAAALTLTPHKLATIVVATSEMLAGSNAERFMRDLLTRAAALALDAALFDSNAATTARPAGLRNGVSATTESTATTPFEAMADDLQTLASIVAPVAGNGPITFVVDAARAVAMRLRMPQEPLTVLASSAIGPRDVICIAPAALVSATGAVEIDSRREVGSVHMEGQTPLPIASGPQGTATLATPVRSLWQTDSVDLRLLMLASWALRDARAISWLTTTKW
jgi:hypothetical protein